MRRIVSLWPKPGAGDQADSRRQLAPYLAADFDPVDFVNEIASVSQVLDVEEGPGQARVEFVDVDGCIHRAIFTPGDGAGWGLSSLKFQCPVCFGTGLNDDLRCETCGGTGWGVS